MHPTVTRVALLLATSLTAGCLTSTQRIRVACVPERVDVYVDGRLLEAGEEGVVVLRTDEPHKIFVKGPGYEPRLVVLEPRIDAEGRETLGPEEVCIEVTPIGMDRTLELEMEHDVQD